MVICVIMDNVQVSECKRRPFPQERCPSQPDLIKDLCDVGRTRGEENCGTAEPCIQDSERINCDVRQSQENRTHIVHKPTHNCGLTANVIICCAHSHTEPRITVNFSSVPHATCIGEHLITHQTQCLGHGCGCAATNCAGTTPRKHGRTRCNCGDITEHCKESHDKSNKQTKSRKKAQSHKSVSEKSVPKSRISKLAQAEQRERTLRFVEKSGFYFGDLSMTDAKDKLRKASNGSFLLRDSSDQRFVLSISVKTPRGVTSIRVSDSSGDFRLDCDESSLSRMPSFDCILKLIDYFVEQAKTNQAKNCVFVESSGRKDTPVLLQKPFFNEPRSLAQSCTVALNRLVSPEKRDKMVMFMHPRDEQSWLSYPYKT